MKKLQRDEHGYINNIGKSKYWGVTTSLVNFQNIWVVSHHPLWSEGTVGLRADGFNLKEVDAARIAAFLYEQSMYSKTRPLIQFILSCDKKYVFDIDLDKRVVRRIANHNQFLVYGDVLLEEELKHQPTLDLLVPTPEETKIEQEQIKEIFNSLNDFDERDLIAQVTDAVMNQSLSPTAIRVLIGILENA